VEMIDIGQTVLIRWSAKLGDAWVPRVISLTLTSEVIKAGMEMNAEEQAKTLKADIAKAKAEKKR
jgi:hypothetical protein